MQPVPPPERPHESVARQIRGAILDGTYGPGDRLPVERELSERFEVSRSVVRQALLILDQQGLVRVKPGVGGGPFVAREPMPAAVTAFENLMTADDVSVNEFIRAKIVLEPAVAGFAAETISATDLERLEDNLARTREAADRGDDVTSLSVEFHSILFRATGNRFLEVVLEILTRSFDRLPAATVAAADLDCTIDDHAEMLGAIRGGASAEVRDLMEKHLLRVWRVAFPPVRP